MVFGKEKLIPDEELGYFLNGFAYAWNEGWSAKKIASEMGFGEPDGTFYENLKPHHVYYFASRYGEEYNLKPRHKQKATKTEGIPYSKDMPQDVAKYLRLRNLLFEST